MGPKLTLYVDTVSPMAYEAYYILSNDPVFKSVEITYIPVFLGGIMKACGNSAPITIKNKDKWINNERLRWAKAFQVPMSEKVPPGFPALTLLIGRALCAVTILGGQEALIKCLDELFPAYWVHGKKTNEKEGLMECLVKVLGEEMAMKVMQMAPKEGKELLGKNTDQALAEGAFGLPYFVAENSNGEKDKIWGVDHMGVLVQHLGIEKPRMGGWKALL